MRPVALGVTLALALAAAASAEAPRKAPHVPGALVLVIDRSLTTQGAQLAAMKAAAIAAIAAFDREVEIVAPLQRAANRARIAGAIGKLRPTGGTNLYVGLKAAHEILGATPRIDERDRAGEPHSRMPHTA